MINTTTAEWYLYPRVCPILSLSREDLNYCIERHGRAETFSTLASLIAKFYDFPYARHGIPRTPPPPSLEAPRAVIADRPKPAPPTMLLGGYRCTRLPIDIRIPGITLIMHDELSKLDWILDGFMESHRMKCWVAVQGKPKRWTNTRNDLRSPYSKFTHQESFAKILDSNTSSHDLFTQRRLREALVSSGEAIPPTVELYLQTIELLKPVSISAPVITYGVSLAAMACVASRDLECSYQLPPEANISMNDFIQATKCALTPINEGANLVFIDAVPFGTHDLRPYLGEKSTPRYVTYSQHILHILNSLRDVVVQHGRGGSSTPTRVALVISLRELPSQPTIEPLLLAILSDKQIASRIQLLGALVSQRRDYAVYLMRVDDEITPQSSWGELLNKHYREIDFNNFKDPLLEEIKQPAVTAPRGSAAETSSNWENICLQKIRSKLPSGIDSIALQGPRKLTGKSIFPTRTRTSIIVSETNNLETGEVLYVFGEAVEPPLIMTPPKEIIADSLIARMVTKIREIAT